MSGCTKYRILTPETRMSPVSHMVFKLLKDLQLRVTKEVRTSKCVLSSALS